MEDFEIDIIEEEVNEGASMQLPMNCLLIGEIENDDVKVYIKQDVYKVLEEYAVSDVSHELGTIILGNYSEVLGKMNVVISESIYAKYTDASASTLTFTHETWEYVHKEHEKKYPDTVIVGWQHTHPGYGIFLSNYDMFIQENFFNLPFQVAYVIDPVQHIRGFFQWKNGKIEKLKGFYIYDEVGKPIKIDSVAGKKSAGGAVSSSGAQGNNADIFQPLVLGVLCLTVIGLLLSTISLHRRYALQIKEQETFANQLAEQNQLLSRQTLELETVKTAVKDMETAEAAGENRKAEEVAAKDSEAKEVAAKDSEAEEATAKDSEAEEAAAKDSETEEADDGEGSEGNAIAETKDTAQEEDENIEKQEENKQGSRVYFAPYKIEAGDSLSAICKRNNLDYASVYRILLSVNGIKDANEIYVGQTILLPVYE